MRLAVAALVVMLVLSGCGLFAEATPSPATSPATSPTAGSTPSPGTGEPAETAEPGSGGEVGIGAWVETTVDRLRLREGAGLDAPSVGQLEVGSTATVLEGPVEADGYQWYAIAWPGLPAGETCAQGADVLDCWTSGWVAGADPDGTPWLAATRPSCPEGAGTVEELAALAPGARLACFGNQALELRAYLAPETEGRGCTPGYDHDPAWLGPCPIGFLQATETQFESEGPEMAANVHPDLGACDFGGRSPDSCPFVPYIGQWIQVTGHFDDPASPSCTIEPWPNSQADLDPALVEYRCRERFVVTAIEPSTAP